MQAITNKTGSFQGSSNTLGGGGRFKQMVASGKSPALAAFIGKKIYGKKKMSAMAAKGKAKTPASPSTQMSAPKGIAIGNPNAINA